jgi:peptidoglycan/LPS O-acetylase OafA/YrhL
MEYMDTGRHPQIKALTGLRFIAALAVLLTHYNGESVPGVLYSYLTAGNTGVCLFFMLSGFVLSYNYLGQFDRRVEQAVSFFQARFARIYPLHLLTLLLVTPWVLSHVDFSSGGAVTHISDPRVALSWLANLFLVQAWFSEIPDWNGPSWSIANEAAFYLIFPFFVAGVVSRFRSIRSSVIGAVVAWAVGLSLFVAAALMLSDDPRVYYWAYHWPIFRVWEFLIGVFLGAAVVRMADQGRQLFGASRRDRFIQNGLLVIALCCIGLIPVLTSRLDEGSLAIWAPKQMANAYPFYIPFFAFFIVMMATCRTPLHGFLEHRYIVLLGEASYALYMIQKPVINVIHHSAASGSLARMVLLAVAFVPLIAGSVLVYRFVEQPARRALRPRVKVTSPSPPILDEFPGDGDGLDEELVKVA